MTRQTTRRAALPPMTTIVKTGSRRKLPASASVEDTAAQFGLTVPVLKKWLRAKDGRTKPRQDDLDELAALTAAERAALGARIQAEIPELAAATVAETALRYGVTERSIAAWLRVKGKMKPRQSDLDELADLPAEQVEQFVTGFQVINKAGLRKRGWTDKMMRELLPAHDVEYPNQHYRYGAMILAWFQYRIVEIESGPDCAAKLAKRSAQVTAGRIELDAIRLSDLQDDATKATLRGLAKLENAVSG